MPWAVRLHHCREQDYFAGAGGTPSGITPTWRAAHVHHAYTISISSVTGLISSCSPPPFPPWPLNFFLSSALHPKSVCPFQGLIRRDGTGLATFPIKFECIVFRPVKGEVMDCVVTSVNKV